MCSEAGHRPGARHSLDHLAFSALRSNSKVVGGYLHGTTLLTVARPDEEGGEPRLLEYGGQFADAGVARCALARCGRCRSIDTGLSAADQGEVHLVSMRCARHHSSGHFGSGVRGGSRMGSNGVLAPERSIAGTCVSVTGSVGKALGGSITVLTCPLLSMLFLS